MSDLQDLYQELIIDHSKRPRNFRAMEGATQHADGYNPLCGDKVSVFVKMENGRVADVSFLGAGCAISTSSASLLTESIKGKTREEAEALFETFHRLVTEGPDKVQVGPGLGKLAVFGGVSKYPARVKCAVLAWHTFKAALDEKKEQSVTTE